MLNLGNLHPYQRDTIDHVLDGAQSLVFEEMGLGKTVAVCTAVETIIAEDAKRGRKRRFLVVAPKRVALHVWTAEVKLWAHLAHLKVRVALGTPKQRLHALTDPQADIVTINYENVPWLLKTFPKGKLPFYGVVYDEVDKMKQPGTKRFAALRYRVHEFAFRVGMTGTPAPESLQNVWGPTYLVTGDPVPGAAPYRNGRLPMQSALGAQYERFCAEYFEPDFTGHKLTARPGALRAISERIAPYTITVQARDHLDLPELVVQNHVYELEPKVLAQYREFEREFVLALERGDTLNGDDDDYRDDPDSIEAEAVNAAVLKNKLRQICSGFVYHHLDKGARDRAGRPKLTRCTAWLHNHKVNAYHDLVSELMGEPHLAVYGYKAEVEKLEFRNRLGGGTTDAQEQDILRQWEAGQLSDLAMHPASAGHGLNLHRGGAHHIAFLTLPWSRGLYDQTIGRLHRMGQKRSVFVHRFIALGTVEEDVVAALESKGDVQQQVIDAMKRRNR